MKKRQKLYNNLKTQYQEKGDHEALETARALLESQANITLGDRERLFGYLEGGGKIILPEPQALLTEAPKMPGIDGMEVLRRIRKAYPKVQVITLTGHGSEKDEEEARTATRASSTALLSSHSATARRARARRVRC